MKKKKWKHWNGISKIMNITNIYKLIYGSEFRDISPLT